MGGEQLPRASKYQRVRSCLLLLRANPYFRAQLNNILTSLSATVITRCSAWVHLGNINYTGIKYQQEYITLQGLNTELVYFGI
jgi:hypothetical protein